MNKKKTVITFTVILILLLLGGGVWAFWGNDAQLKKVQEMGKEMFGEGKPRPTPEQMNQFRKETEKLTPEQHRKLHEPRRRQMAQQMNKRLDDYFAMPPEKRKDILDKAIKDGEKRRKDWGKRRKEWERNKGTNGQGANRSTPGGPGRNPQGAGKGRGPGNAGGRPPGGRRNRTPEERAQRRNQWMDHIPPNRRAQWHAFMDDMRKRRIELGLPASPFHGHGRR